MTLILFDLNGTLLDPGEHGEQIQAGVRLAMVHTLAGEFRPLAELIAAAGGEVPERMPAFADVPAGLERLAQRGHRLVVLTNSARATAERHLSGAGVRERFERVIGADEIGSYKPDRRTYAYALARLGCAAAQAWMVAAHDWDLIGAHLSGLRTAFLDRGGPAPRTVPLDLAAADLRELEIA